MNDEVNYEEIRTDGNYQEMTRNSENTKYWGRDEDTPWQQYYAAGLTPEAKAKYVDHVYAYNLDQHRREYTSNIVDLLDYLEKQPEDYLEYTKRNLVVDNNLVYMIDFIKWSIAELEKHIHKDVALPTSNPEILEDPNELIQKVCTVCISDKNDWENYGVKGFWHTPCTYEDTAMEYLETWNRNIEHQDVSFDE